MEYVDLGTSGIKVSPLCLGGMSFGEVFPDFHQWVIDESETTNVIARAYELGINFIDTANGYARGTSEQFIGRSLRKLGIPRESMVLASKVFFNEGALGKAAIEREIDKTLTNLQTDYLDLYIIHRYDYNHPIEETLEALDGLVRAGKVRALGASEMYAYQLHNMQLAAERNGWTKFCSMQLHHNLLYRENEREMIPVCRQYDMAITPYSPLASGHLTRRTWEGESLRAESDSVMRNKYDSARENDQQIIDRVAVMAQEKEAPMADIALAWLWARGITSPIVGCSRPSRVDDAVRALDVTLTEEDLVFLEETYRAHELVGPIARPGETPLAGTTTPPR